MWCLQMLQANAYVLYKNYMAMYHIKAITHFEFNIQICLAWIDSENYWPKKKCAYQHKACSVDSTSSTTRSTNTVSSDFINRALRFTEKSLCPLSSNIRVRLQEYDTHWTVPNLKKMQVVNNIVGQWAQTRRCEVVCKIVRIVR